MTNVDQKTLQIQISQRSFEEIDQLSDRDKAYQRADPALSAFYKYSVELKSFATVIEKRKQYPVDRATLTRVIRSQYEKLDISTEQEVHLDALTSDNTFTVVTAHQPSLLTGPLYYIYKIASTIHLCRDLKEHYPDYQFVPVFINGSEDHDFEEVNHAHVFGNRIEWEGQAGGPVGRMPIHGLQNVLDAFAEIMGHSQYADEVRSITRKAIDGAETYNDFTRKLVHSLFSKYGLISINMDDHRLKSILRPLLKREITEQFSKPLIEATQAQLAAVGYKSQAFPRPINIFYISDTYRDRIVKEGDSYSVNNQDITWSESELLAEIDEHPERFSPNVNMRPLYQETVLPNLAYIGGGGELAYWMERGSQFEAAGVSFPMLIRRNSVLLLETSTCKMLTKLNLSKEEIWQPEHVLIHQLLEHATAVDLDVSPQTAAIEKCFDDIAQRAGSINPGLAKYVQAEKTKQLKAVEHIGSRLLREIKSQEETKVKQLKKLKEKLFPGNGLQERHDNIWQYYCTYGPNLIDYLVDHLDPMDKDFVILEIRK